MILGIDASSIRAGGGITHLAELLRAADPPAYGFQQIYVWGCASTLNKIEDRSWLRKLSDPFLDRPLPFRVYWQQFKLGCLANAANCDVLLVPGGSDASGFRPVVSMSQNLLPFEWRELRRYGFSLLALKLILLRFTQSRTFHKSDGVIFLSDFARTVVSQQVGILNGKSAVIPHGVDPRFVRAPRPQRLAREFSWADPCRLLYVSIIDAYKHQWHVAEAVAQLRGAGIPVTLDLVGPARAPSLARLRRTLLKLDPKNEFIRYVGAVAHEDIHKLYEKADLNIFASSCENMPNILLEGMASGLPIACSSLGPMPDVLGNAGVYFHPERPSEIAAAIQFLIESAELREEKARLAFERAQAYSWAQCANATFRFLQQVCDSPPVQGGINTPP